MGNVKNKFLIVGIAIIVFILASFGIPNLSKVYDICEMTQAGTLQFAIGYAWTNGLFYIDNDECTWKLFALIPITSILNEKPERFTYDDEHLRKLHCVQTFDKLYEKFLKQPSCPNHLDSVCEPISFENVIRENKEFNESLCVHDLRAWAYLSEHNDVIWQSLSHQYSLVVPKENSSDTTIPIIIEEWGYHMCDDFNVTIISHDEKREIVWQYKKTNFCVVAEPAKWQKFVHKIPNSANPPVLEPGNYYAILYYGDLIPVDSLLDYDVRVDELTKAYFGVKNEK